MDASNHLTNSSCTTRCTSRLDSQSRSRGKIVPASGSYSSVFSSKLIPAGSWRNKSAATASNRPPYSALSRRRSSKISSRVRDMRLANNLSEAFEGLLALSGDYSDSTNSPRCVQLDDIRLGSTSIKGSQQH